MTKEKVQGFVYRGLAVGLLLIGGVLFLKVGLSVVLPFGLAYLISVPVRPVCSLAAKRTRIPERIWAVLFIVVGTLALGAGLWFVISGLAEEVAEALGRAGKLLSDPDNPVRCAFDKLIDAASNINFPGMDGGIDIGKIVSDALSSISTAVGGFVGSLITSAPSFFLFIFVFWLSLYYFFSDTNKIKAEVCAFLPNGTGERLGEWVGIGVSGVKKFARAYLSLLGITFVLLSIGFWIIGVEYPLLFALLTSVVDILPILGLGTVLLPWAALLLVMGETLKAVSMLVLFALMYVIRQVLEPKFVGNAAGVHPLIALFSVYLGFKISGVGGMIIAPLLLNALCVFLEEKRKKRCSRS